MRPWRALAAGAALLLTFASARAHDPGLSSIHVVGRPGWAEIILQFAPADFLLLAKVDLDGDGRLLRPEFETSRALIEKTGLSWIEIRAGEKSVPLASLGTQFQEKDNNVVITLTASAPPLETWTLSFPRLSELPARHRQFLTAANSSRRIVAETLLDASQPRATVNWQQSDGALVEAPPEPPPLDAATRAPTAVSGERASSPSRMFGQFLLLGVEHILIGFDHLLFLAALLLACRHFKSMIGIITSFTLAHSITLGLATFGVVNFPSKFVEAAIAASILYVGLENIFRRDEPRARWLLTFFLGLIHGFGFAGVLRELGIGANGTSFVTPLVGFNLGVELGQIAVAAVFLPLLFYVRRYPWFEQRGAKILSGIAAAAGLFWLIERLM